MHMSEHVSDLILQRMMQESASLGEVATWRVQRLNVILLLASAVSLAAVLPAITALNPVMTA